MRPMLHRHGRRTPAIHDFAAETKRIIPGAENIDVFDPEIAPTVMAGLGPAIHGSIAETKERHG